MRRLTPLMTALLLLAPAPALAQTAAVKLSAAQTAPAAVPGGYVTLMYSAEGQGEYVFEADGGADWQPVTRTRTLKLSGRTLLPVTFRVPALAAVGESPPLVLRALQGGSEAGRSQGFAQVQPRPKLRLSSPAQVSATTDRPLVVPVEVTNLGNQTDTVTLSIGNLDTRAHLSQQQVTLRPGESRTVTASLKLERVSDNFLYVLFFEAASLISPRVTASARTDSLFNSVKVLGSAAGSGPMLTLGLGSSLDAAATWTPQGRNLDLRYSVRPTVSGAFSDYLDGQAEISGLEGTTLQPIPRGVSFGVGFKSQRWGANLNISSRSVGVSGTYNWREWLLSSSARYQALSSGSAFGVSVGASTRLAGGQLALDASSSLLSVPDDPRRSDSFGVSYARTFGERWTASAGLRAGGTQTGGRYNAALSVSQQLSYNAQAFDVTQTYFGSLGGLQVLGLSGGLRSTQPFGVRGAVSLLVQPAGLTWTTSGLLLYSAPKGFGVSLSGRAVGGSAAQQQVGWQVALSASAPPLRLGSVNLSTAAAYTLASSNTGASGHTGSRADASETDTSKRNTSKIDTFNIAAPWTLTHEASLSTALTAGGWQGAVNLNWKRGADTAQQLRLGVSSSYVWQANTFAAKYSVETQPLRIQSGGQLAAQRAEASWSRDWTERFSSTLSYSRAWWNQTGWNQSGGVQSLGLTLGLQDAGLPGLSLSAGYRLSSPLDFSSTTQAVNLGVSYNLAYRAATPGALVNFFGGRRGGKVHGVLFQDDNLSGVQDAGEAGLAGVHLQIGGVKAVTDAGGAYQLQVPVGSYTPVFTAGLPATVEALSLQTVEVKENADIPISVAFAPVWAANALIFNDLNVNGVQDEGEASLPYASVQVTGPVSRTVQADARGYARLSALPAGEYRLSLPADGLPQGFVPSRPEWGLSVRAGQTVPDLQRGAARPERKIITTYTAGSLTVLGSFAQDQVVLPGQAAQLKLQLSGVQSLTVSAFGQTYTPKLEGAQLSQSVAVPPDTAPGTYDVTVVASGEGGQKSLIYKLLIQSPTTK